MPSEFDVTREGSCRLVGGDRSHLEPRLAQEARSERSERSARRRRGADVAVFGVCRWVDGFGIGFWDF